MLFLIGSILSFAIALIGVVASFSAPDAADIALVLLFAVLGVLLFRAWEKRRTRKAGKKPEEPVRAPQPAAPASGGNEAGSLVEESVDVPETQAKSPAPAQIRVSGAPVGVNRSNDNEEKRPMKGESILQPVENYIALDVETTGLNPELDEIIEVAAVRVRENEVVERFTSLVKPRSRIDDRIVKLTGITNEMVQGAPPIEQVLPDLFAFIGKDLILGHNVNFDINFIYDKSEECGLGPVTNNYLDTLRLSRRLYPEEKHHRLEDLIERFHVGNTVEHRAMSDVLQTKACYDAMQAEIQARGITMKPPTRTGSSEAMDTYFEGEDLRKAGNLEEALAKFDAAAGKGYVAPALYESYALVYRKQREYQKEIDIIDLGIERLQCKRWPTDRLQDRREKAVQLLAKEQADQQSALEKAKMKEEKQQARQATGELSATKEKKPQGRPILQLDDDGNVVRQYKSIAEAARESGINAKSIREAATGAQRHAGGFCWKYEDQNNE